MDHRGKVRPRSRTKDYVDGCPGLGGHGGSKKERTTRGYYPDEGRVTEDPSGPVCLTFLRLDPWVPSLGLQGSDRRTRTTGGADRPSVGLYTWDKRDRGDGRRCDTVGGGGRGRHNIGGSSQNKGSSQDRGVGG